MMDVIRRRRGKKFSISGVADCQKKIDRKDMLLQLNDVRTTG
jgi:hypothetical protein